MSGALEVSPEGLRSAAASGDELAGELATTPTEGGTGGGVPTAAAVQAVHALVAGVRADQAVFLVKRSGSLVSGATGYEQTDGSSAGNLDRAM